MSELCQKAEAADKKLYFSLTCDEMAIKKHVEFDGKNSGTDLLMLETILMIVKTVLKQQMFLFLC